MSSRQEMVVDFSLLFPDWTSAFVYRIFLASLIENKLSHWLLSSLIAFVNEMFRDLMFLGSNWKRGAWMIGGD